MSLKLRVRKDPTQPPGARWRVEIHAYPVGEGPAVGNPSWVVAMVMAKEIQADAKKKLAALAKVASK